MALQKKKRNLILKFLWKKSQLKKLIKINLNKFLKQMISRAYNNNNILNIKMCKYKNIFTSLVKNKFDLIYFLKCSNLFNVYYTENKVIKFNDNYLNSSKLVNFLINFYDNIIRDFSTLKRKNISNFNKHLRLWKKYDIYIILLKIKKIFKYFYIFLDYFNVTLLYYYLTFYNYFKVYFNNYNLICNNILNFVNINSFFNNKKLHKFNYFLIRRILRKNVFLNYFVKKQLGYFYHHKTYLKSKKIYLLFVKKLKKRKDWFFVRSYLYQSFFKLKFLNFNLNKDLSKIYFLINYLNFSIFFFDRNYLYPRFLINKIYLVKKFFFKKKNLFPNYILYKKDFNYINDRRSQDFYNKYHISNWDNQIFNVFKFKLYSRKDRYNLKSKYVTFQNNYFNNFIWSWNIIFIKSKKKRIIYKNFKFFNVKNIKFKFLYFFFKIYKLRNIFNYLIFTLLPLNLNLIWVEYGFDNIRKSRTFLLDYLKQNVSKDNWFIQKKSLLNRTKSYISSFFFKKKSIIIKKKSIRNRFMKLRSSFLIKNYKILNYNRIGYNNLIKFNLKNYTSYVNLLKKKLFLNFFNILYFKKFFKKLNKFNFNSIIKYKFFNKKKIINFRFFFNIFKKNLKYKNSMSSKLLPAKFLNLKLKDKNFIRKNFYNNSSFKNFFRKGTFFFLLNYTNFRQNIFFSDRYKKLWYFQDIMLYFTTRDSEIISSSLHIFSQEFFNIFSISKNYFNKLFKLKKKKKFLFNNIFIFITKLSFYMICFNFIKNNFNILNFIYICMYLNLLFKNNFKKPLLLRNSIGFFKI